MKTRETVAYRIRQLCQEQGLTPNGISIIAGVPQATVKSILNGESKNPGIVTVNFGMASPSARGNKSTLTEIQVHCHG